MPGTPVSIFDLLASVAIEIPAEKVACAKLDYVLFPNVRGDASYNIVGKGSSAISSVMILHSRARTCGVLCDGDFLKRASVLFRDMLEGDFAEGRAFRSHKRARLDPLVAAPALPSSEFEGSVKTMCHIFGWLYDGMMYDNIQIGELAGLLTAIGYYDIGGRNLKKACLEHLALLPLPSDSEEMDRSILAVFLPSICSEETGIDMKSRWLRSAKATWLKMTLSKLAKAWPEPKESNLGMRTVILGPLLLVHAGSGALEKWLDETATMSREQEVELLNATLTSLRTKYNWKELAKALKDHHVVF